MVLHQSLPSSSSTTASHDAASVNNHNNNNHNNKRRVRFQALVDCLEFDGTLTDDERELVWYNPDELKARSKRELTLARQLWKNTTTNHHHRAGVSYGTARNNNHRDYCWRGLEKRLRSPDAQRKKWYTFLHSFLALQEDVRHMDRMNNCYYPASHRDSLSSLTSSSSSSNNNGNHACCHYYTRDNTHLLMVFASTNSKADRAKAHQVGLQDEAEAYKVYSSCSNNGNHSCTLTLLRPRRSSLTANSQLQDQEEKDREAAELRRAFSLKLHLGHGEQPQQQQQQPPGTSSSAANGNVDAGGPINSNSVKACARARSA